MMLGDTYESDNITSGYTIPGELSEHCPSCGASTIHQRDGARNWTCSFCYSVFPERTISRVWPKDLPRHFFPDEETRRTVIEERYLKTSFTWQLYLSISPEES